MQYEKKIGERDNKIEDLQMKISGEKREIFSLSSSHKAYYIFQLLVPGLEDLEDSTTKHRDEIKQIIMQYDAEISRRDDEIESFKSKFSGIINVFSYVNKFSTPIKIYLTTFFFFRV